VTQAAVDLDVHLPAIGAGDPVAFGHWLAGAELPLRAALRPFAAACDTEAALQEALLRVWQLAPKVTPDGRGNSLLRFAYRVLKNLCLDEARRLRGEPLDESLLPDELSPALPDPLLRRAIEECRGKLPHKPALALTARLGADEPDATLARRLGMTLNTFLQNFTRARKLLADCLGKKQVTV
jgi:DNA-directed RNA polymerase specialized sigma24 family protein